MGGPGKMMGNEHLQSTMVCTHDNVIMRNAILYTKIKKINIKSTVNAFLFLIVKQIENGTGDHSKSFCTVQARQPPGRTPAGRVCCTGERLGAGNYLLLQATVLLWAVPYQRRVSRAAYLFPVLL